MDSVVTVVGNLTREIDLRYTTSGKAVASFGVACNRRYQVSGSWEEKVSFFTVTAWDTLAENAAASLGKGSRVIVTGRLEQREYEAQDGTKRNVVEIVADEVGASLRWATVLIERVTREVTEGAGSRKPPKDRDKPAWGDDEPFNDIGIRHDGYRDFHLEL